MCAHHVLRSNIETGRGSNYFGHPCMLGLVLEHCGLVLGGGAKLIAPKIEILRFCARIAFLARAKFLRQPLVTYKTFGKNRFFRMFLICPKNALVTFGVCLPPSLRFRQFFLGTKSISAI